MRARPRQQGGLGHVDEVRAGLPQQEAIVDRSGLRAEPAVPSKQVQPPGLEAQLARLGERRPGSIEIGFDDDALRVVTAQFVAGPAGVIAAVVGLNLEMKENVW